MKIVFCMSWSIRINYFLGPDKWEEILWEENIFCYNDTAPVPQREKVPCSVPECEITLLLQISRGQIWSLFIPLPTPLFFLYIILSLSIIILTYCTLEPVPCSCLHPEASLDDRPLSWNWKTLALGCLPGLSVLRVFQGSKSTVIFEKVGLWRRASQYISNPYKGGFYASRNFLFLANFTWRYFPIWTGYKVAEKAVCLGCKVWATIPCRWELSSLTRSIRKPFGYVKSCENDLLVASDELLIN